MAVQNCTRLFRVKQRFGSEVARKDRAVPRRTLIHCIVSDESDGWACEGGRWSPVASFAVHPSRVSRLPLQIARTNVPRGMKRQSKQNTLKGILVASSHTRARGGQARVVVRSLARFDYLLLGMDGAGVSESIEPRYYAATTEINSRRTSDRTKNIHQLRFMTKDRFGVWLENNQRWFERRGD